MNREYKKRHPMTLADEIMLAATGSELAFAFVKEAFPDGPANYPRVDQARTFARIKEKLRNKSAYYVGEDGRPYHKVPTPDEEAKDRHDLFGA